MIKIENLTKTYDKRVILNKVNIEMNPNQITVIVGKSGAGKTTLFRVLSGLEKQDSGTIHLGSNDKLGMVFQKNHLYPHIDVMNNLVIPQKVILKRKRADAINKAKYVLDELGITYLEKSRVSELSGGEAQRVAIARTLVMEKNIILLDEPTSALDRDNTEILIDILKTLKSEITFIIITHDTYFAEQVSDVIYTLKDGVIK